ncbi:GGDEF domain-containing protein [Rhizobium sp. AQ_MP]|uniref:GGDEF domain-containing protein n=1 Tax=Rhizobium sp. AQ_MP TaxID=2761536 RepID=UPI00163A7A82|nr:GGDEF domain-containing protein [Rhizobium sp. AQ_MP]MBC2774524.1 GGDEF domain-containing protein [Rhizobium sp. AQ_MP]
MELRAICGDTLFIVAVTGAVSAEVHAALFDAGIDDLLSEESPQHLLRCLLRARRHLTLLHAQERKLDALQDKLDAWQDGLDHLPTPIYIKDVAGRYIGCNTAFSQFVGTERHHVIGQTLADFLPHDTAEAHRESDLDVMRSGGVIRVETDVCVPDTGMRHVMLHKACIAAPDGGLRGIAGVLIDITERKELEARLTAAAERDPLTNAFNRRKFFQVAASAVERISQGETRFAVAVIDIDHFKVINDQLGHGEGDVTLCSIVDTLRAYEDDGVLVARAGGEEFFAFFSGENAVQAEQLLERMRADIARYCQVVTEIGTAGTISIGLADFDPMQESIDQALRRADLALYRAKRDGRNRLCKAP